MWISYPQAEAISLPMPLLQQVLVIDRALDSLSGPSQLIAQRCKRSDAVFVLEDGFLKPALATVLYGVLVWRLPRLHGLPFDAHSI